MSIPANNIVNRRAVRPGRKPIPLIADGPARAGMALDVSTADSRRPAMARIDLVDAQNACPV